MDLNIVWFLLVGVLIIGYAVLDGFDLGIGSLYHVLAKTEEEKRTLRSTVGPFWDGNEVWLLTGGGALFAAFPPVYATVFSGFYLAMMLVVFGLILRAVSLEYRDKVTSQVWQKRLDILFNLGSFLPALLFGVAVGNVAGGLPLDANHYYTGGFFGLLNPYALVVGLLGLAAILMQGITFTLLKTEGAIHDRAKQLSGRVWGLLAALYVLAAGFTFVAAPGLFANYAKYPVLYLLPLLAISGILFIPYAMKTARYGLAFISSSIAFAGMILTLAMGMFPNLVPAVDPALSLSIYNASSSQLTLKAMLIIALLGCPLVIFYTAYVYRVFKGKTVPHQY